MISSFQDRETEMIFRRRFSRKLPHDIQRNARRKLEVLDAAETLEALHLPPVNCLEKLSGDRQGQYSIRFNDQEKAAVSYDLDFWKYRPGVTLNHQEVYEELSAGHYVDGLEELPIAALLGRLQDVFSADGWTQLDDSSWVGAQGAFEVYTTSQFFRVDCYGMESDDMNKFIAIASEFGCPLYDPQVGERFDGN